MSSIEKEEFGILSRDKRNTLHVIFWKPAGKPKAALQLVHGMVEFIDRYDSFARYLCSLGFAVMGHDHLGHGLSAANDEDLGYFARQGGDQILIEDMYQVTEEMKERCPDVPHFILGHSMGSFCLRKYLTMYGDKVDGAIIMGTGNISLFSSTLGLLMSKFTVWAKGQRYRSTLLTSMVFRGYLKGISSPRTPMDWLTKDEAVVDAYCANKYNSFQFTASAYADFFRILCYDAKEKNMDRIPRTLPILFVSGQKDPVGNWGAGPKKLYERYKSLGFTDVELTLYPDDRHEVLNETDRQSVYEDLAGWLMAHFDY